MESFEKDQMLSVKEASYLLGASVDSVRRWIKRGELKAWKFPDAKDGAGNESWRIRQSEIDRFIRRNEA